MMDVDVFRSVIDVLSIADHARRNGESGGGPQRDEIGDVHLILFGDFKQLPPATGEAPFVVEPRVRAYEFSVLSQNRRVVQNEARRDQIQAFHGTLADISMCDATQSVRDLNRRRLCARRRNWDGGAHPARE